MKNLTLPLAALALAAFGCAPADSDSAIRILSARAIPSSAGVCTFADTESPSLTRGSLDISSRNRYLAQFGIESILLPLETEVGDEVIAGAERLDFIADQMVVNYTLSGSSVTFEEEALAMYALIRAGASAEQIVDLIGPKAAATLATAVPVGGVAELLVRFQLRGHLASGAAIRSTEITFPITVFNSGFTGCATGEGFNPAGPCGTGGGQDGIPVCCPADATTGEVTCPGADA